MLFLLFVNFRGIYYIIPFFYILPDFFSDFLTHTQSKNQLNRTFFSVNKKQYFPFFCFLQHIVSISALKPIMCGGGEWERKEGFWFFTTLSFIQIIHRKWAKVHDNSTWQDRDCLVSLWIVQGVPQNMTVVNSFEWRLPY